MSTIIDIRGVPVQFPFKPYDLQKDYMEKVLECLQKESVAVLESPTGTGKTLCLLCSSLAWLQLKKAQLQAERQSQNVGPYLDIMKSELEEKAGEMAAGRMFLGMPTIIYASRTHTQLHQAIQELKRSAYSHMKAVVLGSRDLLCIHPELKNEDSSQRLQMCQVKRSTRSCHLFNRTESQTVNPDVCNTAILDIEDMVTLGQKHTFCPYYMTKELQKNADIIFTPYNYLLDPISRKALGVDVENSVIILDEGHNIEKACEENASVDLKTTDLVLATEELTAIMKLIFEVPNIFEDSQDIDPEYVASFKEMLLQFIDVIYEIPLNTNSQDVTNFPGNYIFELLEKARITGSNVYPLIDLITKMLQFLASQNSGPFARKGKGLQLFSDFLMIAFANHASREKVNLCYKVHVKEEEVFNRGKRGANNTWLSAYQSKTGKVRILSFWCFSPGFGMNLMTRGKNIKALILTSGTLAPLKPLISELELDVQIRLENPHIVKENQICVKVLPVGPDGEPLNSNFQNRDNPKYINSLGRAIVNLARIIPSGLLIFFPSYPIMQKCQQSWQEEGIWTNIMAHKAIFVEPKDKDAFNTAMTGYYEKIQDPNLKGAIFMAVCRGKVSEGLDFADANGRAVIITGLPFPPIKDAKVILKKRYLDICHAKNKEYPTGSDWYALEASRAVNQAIGRVIRHRHDYGAILLLDERFGQFRIKEQMSKWLKDYVKVVTKYGEVIRDLSQFFRKAQSELPAPQVKVEIPRPKATFDLPQNQRKGNFDFGSSSASTSVLTNDSTGTDDSINQYIGTGDNPNGTVTIHSNKRENLTVLVNKNKRKKITLCHKQRIGDTDEKSFDKKSSMTEYVGMAKAKLGMNFKAYADQLKYYSTTNDLEGFLKAVDPIVPQKVRYIFIGLYFYIRNQHKSEYAAFLRRNNLPVPEEL